MSGAPVYVAQALPNAATTFKTDTHYWIAFGRFMLGEVLDMEKIPLKAELSFPSGFFSLKATLNRDQYLDH